MDITVGFQLEEPSVLVRWGVSEDELQKLFEGLALRRVTHGYYTIRCQSLHGLWHDLGFHFTPRGGGWLTEFELFESSAPMDDSYLQFQNHLEATFGQPTQTSPGTEGFLSHVWLIGNVRINHFVRDRFGPEQRLRIERVGSKIEV